MPLLSKINFLSTSQHPLCFDFTKSKYFFPRLKNYGTREIQDYGLQIRLDETTSKEICNKYGVMVCKHFPIWFDGGCRKCNFELGSHNLEIKMQSKELEVNLIDSRIAGFKICVIYLSIFWRASKVIVVDYTIGS